VVVCAFSSHVVSARLVGVGGAGDVRFGATGRWGGRAGRGIAGEGRAGQGRAEQSRAGQGAGVGFDAMRCEAAGLGHGLERALDRPLPPCFPQRPCIATFTHPPSCANSTEPPLIAIRTEPPRSRSESLPPRVDSFFPLLHPSNLSPHLLAKEKQTPSTPTEPYHTSRASQTQRPVPVSLNSESVSLGTGVDFCYPLPPHPPLLMRPLLTSPLPCLCVYLSVYLPCLPIYRPTCSSIYAGTDCFFGETVSGAPRGGRKA